MPSCCADGLSAMLRKTNEHLRTVFPAARMAHMRLPFHWIGMVCIAGALLLAGCGKEENVPRALEPEERARLRTRSSERVDTRPVGPRSVRPTPRQITRRTPVPRPDPITIEAGEMRKDNGTSDTEGGWTLVSNGTMILDKLTVDFPVKGILIEAKGQPAGEIWPRVDVNLFKLPEKTSFGGWPEDSITTSTYTEYYRDTQKIIPPGDYIVAFLYKNNSAEPIPPGEDRNVSLRKIVLYPE